MRRRSIEDDRPWREGSSGWPGIRVDDDRMTVSGASEPKVACVLVHWNSWENTSRCLRALALQDYGALRVIVVDNGSTDGSLGRLREAYPWVEYVENGYNAGFAKACNVGARRGLEGGAEFVWFLNNDTEAPPETLRRLAAKAATDGSIGIVGAVLLYLHEPTKVQAWGGGEISLWSGFNRHFTARHTLGERGYLTFASALVRRKTFEDLGGLWERMFMYFEDADFCLRATGAGWRLAVAEDTAILHAEGGSRGTRGRSPRIERIQTTSGMLFLGRHGVVPAVAMAVFVGLRVGKRVVLGEWGALRGVLQGVGDWWRGRNAASRKGA